MLRTDHRRHARGSIKNGPLPRAALGGATARRGGWCHTKGMITGTSSRRTHDARRDGGQPRLAELNKDDEHECDGGQATGARRAAAAPPSARRRCGLLGAGSSLEGVRTTRPRTTVRGARGPGHGRGPALGGRRPRVRRRPRGRGAAGAGAECSRSRTTRAREVVAELLDPDPAARLAAGAALDFEFVWGWPLVRCERGASADLLGARTVWSPAPRAEGGYRRRFIDGGRVPLLS